MLAGTPKALDGIRVLDFTWVRAGPWSTRWLGAMGAEVIKVEWPANERGRLTAVTPEGIEHSLNSSPTFNDTNPNKKSITVFRCLISLKVRLSCISPSATERPLP